MGRPLSKQQLFGANASNNIKVQFHNGTSSVKGYIVEQTGSKRFKCSDASGNTAVCYLVDKASADLAAGEMSISFKYDDNTVQQVTKISRHRGTFSFDGQVQSMPWSFAVNNADGIWQVEEAGTNTSMASSVDLEGDDINGDYPVPGSGVVTPYKLGAVGLLGITYANIGTPYAPGGNVATVANTAAGLYRTKYDGNFTAASNSAPSTWTYDFFGTATAIKSIADTYVSWGQQSDGPGLGESLFSMEWKGYVQVPTTQNYNFYAESDDHIAMWIGTAATGTPADGTRLLGSNNKSMPGQATTAGVYGANSVTLTAGQWYPIRIWFSEHTGGCKAQIFAQGADGANFAGSELTFAYNTATGGYNP
jgi:hypothetical protein